MVSATNSLEVLCPLSFFTEIIFVVVVVDMVVFVAAWKVIKNWLSPETQKLIKFVDKNSIREYIDESQLFTHMGGKVSA